MAVRVKLPGDAFDASYDAADANGSIKALDIPKRLSTSKALRDNEAID